MSKKPDSPQLARAGQGEKFAELVAIISSAAPWLGGPIAEIVGGIATDLKIKRVTQFVQSVIGYADRLQSEAAEKFVKTEDFIDIFEKTAQAVANERDEAKRKLFSNYILFNISKPEIVYDQRLKILRLLEQIDTRHIDLLAALLQQPTEQENRMSMGAPSTTIQRRAPQLRGDFSEVTHETNTLGLTKLEPQYLNLNMTGSGAANLAGSVTPTGNALMAFITTPK